MLRKELLIEWNILVLDIHVLVIELNILYFIYMLYLYAPFHSSRNRHCGSHSPEGTETRSRSEAGANERSEKGGKGKGFAFRNFFL